MELFLATENLHKKNEFEKILQVESNLNFYLSYLSDLPENIKSQYNPIEDALSFVGNAFKKADALFQIIQKPIIAEDSGLCIPKLKGAPGIYSNRYATNDGERINRVLNEMQFFSNHDRMAYFVACICYIDIGGNKTFFIGKSYGTITTKSMGNSGFGYDPIFYSFDLNKSFAEATIEEKNSVSHRYRAISSFVQYLNKL